MEEGWKAIDVYEHDGKGWFAGDQMTLFESTEPLTPAEIADVRRLLRESKNKVDPTPILPEDLKVMVPGAIRSLNYWIHSKHNEMEGVSRVSWWTIETCVRCNSGSDRPFDPAYFECIRHTYESTGRYTVTHEINEKKGKHYVRFQVK